MAKGAKAKAVKGKKPKRQRKNNQLYKLYEVSGDTLKRKQKFCPKCGQGTTLAAHKDRVTCGKCSYMEMTGKK